MNIIKAKEMMEDGKIMCMLDGTNNIYKMDSQGILLKCLASDGELWKPTTLMMDAVNEDWTEWNENTFPVSRQKVGHMDIVIYKNRISCYMYEKRIDIKDAAGFIILEAVKGVIRGPEDQEIKRGTVVNEIIL